MQTPRLAALLLAALVALVALSLPSRAHGEAAELPYLALGDSVPSGTDVPDGNGYPRRLGRRLADEIGRPIRLHNRARAGGRRAPSVATAAGSPMPRRALRSPPVNRTRCWCR